MEYWLSKGEVLGSIPSIEEKSVALQKAQWLAATKHNSNYSISSTNNFGFLK